MNEINCIINDDPGIMSALMVGILFSGISGGLAYVIIFLILWEVLYLGYLNCNNKKWIFIDRLLVILAGILGFLAGRFLHSDDDHLEEFNKFKNDINYYCEEFEWIS